VAASTRDLWLLLTGFVLFAVAGVSLDIFEPVRESVRLLVSHARPALAGHSGRASVAWLFRRRRRQRAVNVGVLPAIRLLPRLDGRKVVGDAVGIARG
jgi:hypothetical protein